MCAAWSAAAGVWGGRGRQSTRTDGRTVQVEQSTQRATQLLDIETLELFAECKSRCVYNLRAKIIVINVTVLLKVFLGILVLCDILFVITYHIYNVLRTYVSVVFTTVTIVSLRSVPVMLLFYRSVGYVDGFNILRT